MNSTDQKPASKLEISAARSLHEDEETEIMDDAVCSPGPQGVWVEAWTQSWVWVSSEDLKRELETQNDPAAP